MGSEDFSEVMLRVPGAFFNLSTGSREEGYLFGAHNPQVRHNEAALPTGQCRLCLHCHALAGRKLLITPLSYSIQVRGFSLPRRISGCPFCGQPLFCSPGI